MAGERRSEGQGEDFRSLRLGAAVHKGIPFAMAKGWPPRNSTRGNHGDQEGKIYFIGQAFRLVFFILSYLFSIDNYDILNLLS